MPCLGLSQRKGSAHPLGLCWSPKHECELLCHTAALEVSGPSCYRDHLETSVLGETYLPWVFIIFGKYLGAFTPRQQRDALVMVWVFWRQVQRWTFCSFVDDQTNHSPGWKRKKPLDNIPEVRLVHANVWCLYPTSLSFAFWGWKQFYSQTWIQVTLRMWEVPFTCSIYPGLRVMSAYAVLTSVRLSSSFTQEPDKSLFCEAARSADRQKLFWI